jgi:hypothetical protein
MNRHLLPSLLGVLLVAACSGPADQLMGDTPTGGPGDPTPAPVAACTEKSQGRSYKGFDGQALEGTRLKENMGQDRARLKPHAALSEEYARVFGSAPASLAAQADAFSVPPPRWYDEPRATGVGMAALYSIGFEAGLTYAKGHAQYAAAPTSQSATTECAAFMKKAWMRTPIPAEIDQCVTLATKGVSKETNPERKWAYVFAMIVSSTPFITY